MLALLDKLLGDPDADAVRRSHANAIRELQGMPAAGMLVIRNVQLPNGVAVNVPHGLGRAPQFVWHSPPRVAAGVALTAGLIVEYRGIAPSGAPINSAEVVVLDAFFYGATITVDVAVL